MTCKIYKDYAVWIKDNKAKDITKDVDELIETDEKYMIDFNNINDYFCDKLKCDIVVGSAKTEKEAIETARRNQ